MYMYVLHNKHVNLDMETIEMLSSVGVVIVLRLECASFCVCEIMDITNFFFLSRIHRKLDINQF